MSQQLIDRISRLIRGSRTSSSTINGRKLQPLATPLPFTHYGTSMSQPARTTNTCPQKVEYVYVYSAEIKKEVDSIAAETQAIMAGLRLRDAEFQRDVARMKLQIEQMQRLQAQMAATRNKKDRNIGFFTG